MKTYTGTRSWLASVSPFALVLAASAALSCQEPPDLAVLSRAFGPQRTLLPRLAGDFEYAPYESEAGGRARGGPAELDAVAAAFSRVRRQADPTQVLRAQGWIHLLLDRGEDAERRGVLALEAARDHASRDAAVFSDLSAAYFTAARHNRQPYDLLAALASAEESLHRDPSLPQAHFNRALALEELSLRHEARRAWEEYLVLDSSSGWAEEARERLLALKVDSSPSQKWLDQVPSVVAAARDGRRDRLAESITTFRSDARRYLEEKLLAEWAEQRGEGALDEAAQTLAVAREMAAVLEVLSRDRLYRATLDVLLKAVETSGDEALLGALLEGHRSFGEGLVSYRAFDLERSAALFLKSRDLLGRAGSPFALRASYYLATCEHFQHSYGQALARYDRLIPDAERNGYLNLLGEALWMKGLTHFVTGQTAAAVAPYEAAIPVFEALDDIDNLAGSHSILSETLESLGETRRAWRHRGLALAASAKISKPLRIYQIYTLAALSAWLNDLPIIARYFQDEAVRAAQRSENHVAVAEALRWRGRIHHLAEDREAALADLGLARVHQQQIPDEQVRRRVEAEILVAESEARTANDPAGVIAMLDEAVAFYGTSGYRLTTAPALLSRARAYLALDDAESAEEDLQRSIELYEQTREELLEERHRISFFERARETFEEMINLQLHHGRMDVAFAFSERKRARVLLDQVSRLGLPDGSPRKARILELTAAPRDLRALLDELDPGTVLVEYAVVKGQLWAWVAHAGGVSAHQLAREASQVERVVQRLLRSLERKEPADLKRAAGELHGWLFSPLEAHLPEGSSLVFVPDGVFYAVPFAALMDSQNGRYLIEDWRIAIAASANLYVESLLRDRQLAASVATGALVVGNPAFDPLELPQLSPLPAAEEEAHAIADLYQVKPWTGDEAVKDRFLAEAGRYPVVHFGGHALVNLDLPARSRLIFAGSARGPEGGSLYAEELYGYGFDQTRLVVLGACSTLGRPSRTAEGIAGLARAFVAARIPGVVASLWAVDDRASAALLLAFHRHFSAGLDAGAALREAQLAALRSDDSRLRSPSHWAAFELLGTASTIHDL